MDLNEPNEPYELNELKEPTNAPSCRVPRATRHGLHADLAI